ncbi:YozD family protein [Sediminibacillus massiliensis]|uniref:YozD family protein n=1 Tax=Sediminibacillus massiliensis TaxID=1926277 RepID=UPI000BAE0EF2|nr:YozD family protein [Sediminibacillus massiliensis]
MDEEVYFTNKDIENYLFRGLIEQGYSPSEEELEVLAELFFDFLLTVGGEET